MNPVDFTIAKLREAFRKKEYSPVEAVKALIKRIENTDPSVQGYLRIDSEDAIAQAESSDLSKPLGGVPIAVKDNIAAKGQLTTCASKILENFRSPYDATVIGKLREAGAILLGRTNMDEFAMGSSTEHSAFQVTKNPWDLQRTPGGSSGGSAAVVAARSAVAALGSDTGGSIRQPAALCGCVGLKPTYGRVSRYGLVAFASSLDQIGPLTRTVEDAALLLNVIGGVDPMDNTSRPLPVPDYTAALTQSVQGLKIGIPQEYFSEGIDPEVRDALRQSIQWYASNGAEILDISLPHTSSATATYYLIATAEASANLARFDGIRYGHRAADPDGILDLYKRTKAEGFGPEVKRRIILGTYALSSGYHAKYYERAQKVRYLLRQDFDAAFGQCDLILTPTAPTPAFKIGQHTTDPLQMYLVDILTLAANLTGVCALSLPCGFSQDKLPIGMQLLGPHFKEETILRAAHTYEQAHPWHKESPNL